MSIIIAIKGTNGSGKSSVVRSLIAYLGKAATLRFNQRESGYRCRYGDGALFVLGKYKTACGGLDSSFSYKGAADDVMLCLDTLAAKGHVVCEGLIAVSNYGFARVTRFVDEQKAKGNHVIFARLDTPVELCVQRVRERRRLAGNPKPFNPEHLLEKHEALLCIQEKLGQAGCDARILPHEEPLQTLLRWFEERKSDPKWRDYKPEPVRYQKTPEELRTEESTKVIEGESSKFQTSARCETSEQPPLNTEVATVDAYRRSTTILETDLKYGMDFRKPEYRREVFLRFYQFHTEFKLHPGLVYLLIPYLSKRLNWTREQVLWFCFINGNTQHPPTSWLIFKRFPDFATLDTAALIEFFNNEWARLEFDTDRRHQKRDFPRAIECYKDLCGDSQEEYFAGFINGSDQEQNFRSAWATVRRDFYGFGRLSAFSYLEYLRIARLPLVCDQLFLSDTNGSKSHRNGLCKVLGRDDWEWTDENPVKYTPEMIAYLEDEGAKLLAEAQSRFSEANYFTLESALCAYKNWFRGRRYPGIYADMFYERVTKAERRWPEEDFGMFWDAYRTLPTYVQSETGVSKEKQARFRDTGQVIAMGNVWDCFKESDECGMTLSTT